MDGLQSTAPPSDFPLPPACFTLAAMLATHRFTVLTLFALTLSACGSGTRYRPVSDTPVRIGPPYTVRGTTYAPVDDRGYDMLGYATWYGSESGRQTANGERFRPKGISAAHRTLPLPSYVEVTSLDSGRRVLVRINDRGPFSQSSRIIDLSRGAADLLGMRAKGHAGVRVRVVQPAERDRKALREGKAAKALPPLPEPALMNLRTQFARGVGQP